MAESNPLSSAVSQSFLGQVWTENKEFLADRFRFFENYSRFTNRDKPLPSWSSSDVEEFIASDPVHGPTLKTARKAVNFGVTGSILGAVHAGSFAWKYSKSPHGALLASGLGAVTGWALGHQIADHALQLHRSDTMAAQVKFLEWWERKC